MDTQTVKQDEQVMVAVEPRHNGYLWEAFPEPRGWSAHWDGFELDYSAQRNGHDVEYHVEPRSR